MINHLFRFASQRSVVACAAMVVAVTSFHGQNSLVNTQTGAMAGTPTMPAASHAATVQSGKSLGVHQVDFSPGTYHVWPTSRT